jgi:3-oxoacyl-(acyl-carrier-protein) synthase
LKTIKHIRIEQSSVFADGDELFSLAGEEYAVFAKAVYKSLEIDYPKFYKMSNMCKLGFLASEYLLKDMNIKEKFVDRSRVAIVLACKASSLQADIEYSKTMGEIPSPALFVYTLANIVTGEIAIRHGIKGEELMLVQQEYDKEQLSDYVSTLIDEGNTDFCITGMVDYDENHRYFADVCLLGR